jgi:hypothetical protein
MWKGCVKIYDSNYIAFLKRQTMETINTSVFPGGWVWGRVEQAQHRGFLRQ